MDIYRSTDILGHIWTFEYQPVYKFPPIFWCAFLQHSCLQSTAQLFVYTKFNLKTSLFYWNLFNKIFHVLPILFTNNFHVLLCTFCWVKLGCHKSWSNPHQLLPKYCDKFRQNIMVSKFWNIGIGGQSNIGIWPNIAMFCNIFSIYRL